MTLIRKPEKPKRSPVLNLKLTPEEVPVVAVVPGRGLLECGVEGVNNREQVFFRNRFLS